MKPRPHPMKTPVLPILTLALTALVWSTTGQTARAQPYGLLTREHVDLRILYSPTAPEPLGLVMRDEDRGVNHAATNVMLVARDSSRLTLPGGTPFGDAGQPFWILPQSQNVNLLYLGVSAEGIAAGDFSSPLSIRLKRMQAPPNSYFIVWQAVGPGQFNIRINTRDGLGANDAFTPLLGSHEHFNWGFSSTGVFCLTFQVSGQRPGETRTIESREFTFGFHVQPLPVATNFLTWQKYFWPPGYDPRVAGPGADPDGDSLDNLHEYAFGSNPTNGTETAVRPFLSFEMFEGERFATWTYPRNENALDLEYLAETSTLLGVDAAWLPLNQLRVTPGAFPGSNAVTTRAPDPARLAGGRFFRLRLQSPAARP